MRPLKDESVVDLRGRGLAPVEMWVVAAFLARNNRLSRLDLQGNRVGAAAQALYPALRQSLQMLDTVVLPSGSEIAVPTWRVAETLNLRGSKVGDAGVGIVGALLAGAGVRELHLESNGLRDEAMVRLADAVWSGKDCGLPQLAVMDWSHNELSDDAVPGLVRLLAMPKLTKVCVACNRFGAGLAALAGLDTAVRELHIQQNNLPVAVARTLAAPPFERIWVSGRAPTPLVEFRGAAEIDVQDGLLGDLGVAAIGPCLGRQLLKVQLGGNCVGDAGASALALAFPELRLELVDLSRNRIGSSGAIALAEEVLLQRLIHLREADLAALIRVATCLQQHVHKQVFRLVCLETCRPECLHELASREQRFLELELD